MIPTQFKDGMRTALLVVVLGFQALHAWFKVRVDLREIIRRNDAALEEIRVVRESNERWFKWWGTGKTQYPRKYWKASCYTYDELLLRYENILDELHVLERYDGELADINGRSPGLANAAIDTLFDQVAKAWISEAAMRPKVAERDKPSRLFEKHKLKLPA